MKSPQCESTNISKNGQRGGKQNYICHHYGRQFVQFYEPKGYSRSIKEHCLNLYVNAMGFRAIERATGVNHNTVINWLRISGLKPLGFFRQESAHPV
jgi:transposase-like protein